MKKRENCSGTENTHEFREKSLKRIRSRPLAYFFLCVPLNGALKCCGWRSRIAGRTWVGEIHVDQHGVR
jgi:hypothetical protein